MSREEIRRGLEELGYGICRDLLPAGKVAAVARQLQEIAGDAVGSRAIAPSHPAVAEVLNGRGLQSIVASLLGADAKPVRVLMFDKTPVRNWAVAWHQDRTIAVAQRSDLAPVAGWTLKAGVAHCEAPSALLERMLTVRWHLDPCGPGQGGLRVLPGSHLHGRLCQDEIRALGDRTPPLELDLPANGALLMRPLLVHGSANGRSAGRRRVLHIELAADEPPPPLRWAWGRSSRRSDGGS